MSMSPELASRFVDDVLSELTGSYTTETGEKIQGQAISYLLSEMRDYDKKWKNLGSLGDFECLLEEHGFKIVSGRNARSNRARVVTV